MTMASPNGKSDAGAANDRSYGDFQMDFPCQQSISFRHDNARHPPRLALSAA